MSIVVGIDEVGYGPILGPLVVSACIFSDQKPQKEAGMWNRLQRSVERQKRGLGNRILVTDSKKAYSTSSGIGHLERTVLAFSNLSCVGDMKFSNFLSLQDPYALEQIKEYPWYSKLSGDSLSKDIYATQNLANNLKEEGLEFLAMMCCYTDVAEFNRIVRETENKSYTVLNSIVKLIRRAVALASLLNEKDITIIADRVGGKMRYSNILSEITNSGVEVLSENEKLSKYKLISDGRIVEIQFEVGADNNYFPVALASMNGKYIREVLLRAMCEYFAEAQPGLKPTAGYYVDGCRFVEDLEKFGLFEKVGISKVDFVRIK